MGLRPGSTMVTLTGGNRYPDSPRWGRGPLNMHPTPKRPCHCPQAIVGGSGVRVGLPGQQAVGGVFEPPWRAVGWGR